MNFHLVNFDAGDGSMVQTAAHLAVNPGDHKFDSHFIYVTCLEIDVK